MASTHPGAAPASGSIPMPGWSATFVTEGTGLPCIVPCLRHYHARAFSERFKDALRCTFLDVRFSAPEARVTPGAPYTLAAAVDDLEAARKAMGLSRFVLVGHSIQGSMALAYALRYPEHVSHVIAIGALPELSPAQATLTEAYWERNASPARKASYATAQRAFAAAAPTLPPDALASAMVRADAAKRWFDPAYDEGPLMAGAPVNMEVIGELFGQPFTLFDGGARVEPPVFLALGRHDYAAPPTSWDGHRDRFRDLTVSVFERSGHTPQVEEATAFDTRVLDWLWSR